MFSLLWTLLIGLLVGAIAKMLMPGKDPGGWIITILLGIAGSFVASFLGQKLGWYQEGQPAGFTVTNGQVLLVPDLRACSVRRNGRRPPEQ